MIDKDKREKLASEVITSASRSYVSDAMGMNPNQAEDIIHGVLKTWATRKGWINIETEHSHSSIDQDGYMEDFEFNLKDIEIPSTLSLSRFFVMLSNAAKMKHEGLVGLLKSDRLFRVGMSDIVGRFLINPNLLDWEFEYSALSRDNCPEMKGRVSAKMSGRDISFRPHIDRSDFEKNLESNVESGRMDGSIFY